MLRSTSTKTARRTSRAPALAQRQSGPEPREGYRAAVVREGGLEPPRPKTLDPKSSASANFATRARGNITLRTGSASKGAHWGVGQKYAQRDHWGAFSAFLQPKSWILPYRGRWRGYGHATPGRAGGMTTQAHGHATDSRWTQLLDDAIAGVGVQCHYQPVIDLDQRVVVGYEALARFAHPDAGGVSPDVWFARARERGIEADLEAVVLSIALDQRPHVPRDCFLAVNVEPDSLRSPKVRDVFNSQSDLNGVVVEITEHSSWEWVDLEPSINAVRAKGALIAVDDAGSGYSGLQQILELRPSILKLDRAIVQGVATDEAKVALVEMIGMFASRVDAWVVAEGIETLADAKRLADMRVPLAQGFLFAVPAPDFTDIDPRVAGQLAAFVDQSGDTMHRLIETVPTIPMEGSVQHAWDHIDSQWIVVVDTEQRPHGLVDPASAIAGELVSTLTVNVNARPAEVAQRLSTSRYEPGAPILVIDDHGRFLGIVTVRRLIGKLSRLAS